MSAEVPPTAYMAIKPGVFNTSKDPVAHPKTIREAMIPETERVAPAIAPRVAGSLSFLKNQTLQHSIFQICGLAFLKLKEQF